MILEDIGDYYLRVTECAVVIDPASCAPSDAIVNLDYRVGIFELDPATADVVADQEPNDDATMLNADLLGYVSNPNGGFYLTTVFGDFSAVTDVDVYSFTVPTDPSFTPQPVANFLVPYATGTDDGNGSTTMIGQIALVDPADLTTAVALIEPTKGGDIGAPIQTGMEYYLFVQHPGITAGTRDFYFISHVPTGGNPLEDPALELTNSVVATPEPLTGVPNGGGGESYFVDALLPDGTPADEDYFALPMPAGADSTWTVNVACGA